MNSNRCSCERGDQPTGSPPDRVAALAADLDGLATQDVDGLSDAALAEQALQLRRLLDRLEGPWLQRSPPSTPAGPPGPTTAPKPLHRQLAARSAPPGRQHRGQRRADRPSPVRRPLTETAQALCAGELSAAHTSALAHGTSDLPDHTTVKAEPVLAAAAHRLDHPGYDGPSATYTWWPTPTALPARPSGATGDTACGWPPPSRAWSPSTACSTRSRPDPAGRLAPWPARPTTLAAATSAAPTPDRAGPPPPGGRSAAPDRRVRPQLTVIVDLDSLLGHQPVLGGEAGWAGPLAPEARPAAGL